MTGALEDPSDAATRERAIDPRRSIALEAPAGSGKTSILVQRFLRLLATVDEPEQILAITFTRKAAGEMRERLLRALHEEPAPEPTGRGAELRELARAARERSRSLDWALETNPARLRIQTIDALNLSLAARLPIAARGAGQREIVDQPAVLYRAAARRALLDAQSDAALRADADLLFGRLDNDFGRFERLLKEMLAARAHWLPKLLRNAAEPDTELCDRVEASLHSISVERMSEARALIPAELIEEGARVAHEVARRRELASHARPGAWLAFRHAWQIDALTLEHWRALAQLALTHAGTWRRVFTPREGFPLAEKGLKEQAVRWLARLSEVRGARELLSELARLPDPRLSRDDARALTALSRVLRLAAGELELLFHESGRADHTAVAAAARQALLAEGLPTDLALRVGADTRHILVDEFQDTSIEQVELLEALTAGWEPGDGRTLFIVGDPMQSIYQFREAEVGLFLRTATRGLGSLRLEPLALTRNFRSAPELVAWANRTFPRCFPERDDARTSAVRYRPCIAGRSERSAGRVHWHAVPAADFEAEGRTIAALVAELRGAEPRATIAILLTARSHAPPIAAALHAAGIAFAGVDLVSLADVPLVRDLHALTRALQHLSDRTAWLALLRAPWCGLSLSEITLLIEPASRRTVWEALSDEAIVGRLGAAARARLARTRAALAPVLAQRDRLEPAAWVESAWLRLGGPAACADEVDLDHARAFFAHLARWAAEPDFGSPLSLEERLAELYATHEGTAQALQIMTIHRAKGLEFDHVIVPGLGRKVRSSPEPLLRWLELPREREGSDLLLAPIPPRARRGPDPLREYLKSLQARRSAHERVRLIYVAATRARSQLHLFADLPGSEAEPTARSGTLLAALWPGVAAEVRQAAPPRAPAREVSPGGGPARLVRLVAAWQPPVIAAGPRLEGLTAALPEPASLEELERRQRALSELVSSRAAERAICDQLRRCARRGRLPGADSPSLERALRERLMRLGVHGPELELEAQHAASLWDRCIADPQLQWIFAAQHSSGEGPFELSGLEAGRLVALTVDRTFLDARGVRWLVNFRPACERRDPEVELERALTLARKLEPREVRGGLYCPVQPIFREASGE